MFVPSGLSECLAVYRIGDRKDLPTSRRAVGGRSTARGAVRRRCWIVGSPVSAQASKYGRFSVLEGSHSGLAELGVPNSDVDLEFSLTFGSVESRLSDRAASCSNP
jgi:hypothetical protein